MQTQTRLRRVLYLVFSLAVTVGVFWYLFTKVSLGEVIDTIRKVDGLALAVFFLLSFSMSVCRTLRYSLLLRIAGHRPSSVVLFLVVLVRNFFSDLLPARLGSLVYVYLATNRMGIPFGAAASSFALSFVFDIIALAPMIILAALGAGEITDASTPVLAIGGLVLAALTLGVLFALPAMFRLGGRMLDWLVSVSGGRFQGWRKAWTGAEEEVAKARSAGVYFRLFGLSLLVRIGKYAALYFLLFALLRPLGYSLAELNPAKVFICLCACEFAASLPVSGIAAFGAYEGAWYVVFYRLFDFPEKLAGITGIAHHLMSQAFGYFLGGIALIILMVPMWRRKGSQESLQQVAE